MRKKKQFNIDNIDLIENRITYNFEQIITRYKMVFIVKYQKLAYLNMIIQKLRSEDRHHLQIKMDPPGCQNDFDRT